MCTWQKFYRISFSFHTYSCCRFILIGYWFVVCDRYTLHCLQLLLEKRARFSRSKKKDEETKLTKTIIRFFPHRIRIYICVAFDIETHKLWNYCICTQESKSSSPSSASPPPLPPPSNYIRPIFIVFDNNKKMIERQIYTSRFSVWNSFTALGKQLDKIVLCCTHTGIEWMWLFECVTEYEIVKQ